MEHHDPITCAGLGEILWDILPSGPRLGGAPANFTFHAKQMGLDSIAVSCVGNDDFGRKAREILKEADVKSLIFESDKETGYVKATLDERGVPTYDFARDTAYDHIPLNDELLAVAKKTQVCCFGTLAQRQADGSSRKAIKAFLDAMPEGAVRVFDINLRENFFNAEVILKGLERCEVFKCNDDELPVVCKLLNLGSLDQAGFAEYLAKQHGIHQFIYTCGEHGSDIFYKGEHSHVPTPKVQVVDTVGAGDSFTATFVALTVQGVNFKAAHQFAVKVAAYVCTQNGAMPILSPELKQEAQALVANAK